VRGSPKVEPSASGRPEVPKGRRFPFAR
jgi:hypothetical protein